MKENSTLNWRSTSTKISIKSYKCFTLKYELEYEPEYAEVRLRYEPDSLKSMLAALDQHLKETTGTQLYETVSFISPS